MTNEPALAPLGHSLDRSQMTGLQVWLKESPCEMTLNESKE
jgi:hypothetical protein